MHPLAIAVGKRSNDQQAELIAKHPDRFAGFAAIPTQDAKAAADELERGVKQLSRLRCDADRKRIYHRNAERWLKL